MQRYGGEEKKKQANGFPVYGIVIFYKMLLALMLNHWTHHISHVGCLKWGQE